MVARYDTAGARAGKTRSGGTVAQAPPSMTPTPVSSRSEPRSPCSWASAREWDECVAANPCATPFHARQWAEAMAEWDGRFRPRALWLRAAAGERGSPRRWLLPLLVRKGVLRRGPFARALAMHPGVYGGPLADANAPAALTESEWRAVLSALRRGPIGRVECFGNPWSDLPAALASELGAETRQTHWIDLTRLPAQPRSTYSKGCKHSLTKAERAQVRAVRLDRARVDEYVEVYRDSLARWNKAASRAYPARVFEHFARTGSGELWGAEMPGGELGAVGTFLFGPRHCVWWHGAMREAHAAACPANALIHALIQEARARGCLRFDFNPSGGHAGVEAFKRSFGAEPVDLHVWRVMPRLSRGGD
jgi:CelD/BcsL family acetyltransferase involved in cellulose biosynthesis